MITKEATQATELQRKEISLFEILPCRQSINKCHSQDPMEGKIVAHLGILKANLQASQQLR